MRVLLSIKPEYAEKILNGTKRFEYRKAVPRNESVRTVVIYATMPVGKVVGEFEVGGDYRNATFTVQTRFSVRACALCAACRARIPHPLAR